MNVKKIIAFSVGPLGSALLGFISLPIVAWLYGPADIGRISMLTVISSFSVLFFSLGLDQSYVREFHDYDNKSRLFKMAITPGLGVIFTVGVFFILTTELLSKLIFNISSESYSIIIIVFIFSSFINRFLSLILRMEERGIAYSMSQVLPKVIFLICIAIIYHLELNFDFKYLLYSHLLSVLSVLLIFLFNTRDTWIASLKFNIDWNTERKMLRFGLPLILGGLAYWGLTAMDKIFIQYYSSYEELALYSISISFASAAIIIQRIFSTVWVPIVYKWISDGEDLSKVDLVREYLLFVVILIFILAGCFSWVISYFLPDYYLKVPYIVVVCLAAPLFYTLSETTVVGLGVMRNSSLSMVASIVAFLCNLFGNFLLVPKYGAEGAAISTAVSFWIFLFLRTEFAIYVWKPIRRFKLYVLTTSVLCIAILFMLYGQAEFEIFIVIWLSMLIVLLLFSKRVLLHLFKVLVVK